MKRIVLVLLASFYVFETVSAESLTLRSLQNQLEKKKATWVAGETKVSTLSPDDQRMLLGADAPSQDFFYNPRQKAFRGAAAFEWRNRSGINYASPILDQGRCGSCVAFAAIGQLETQMNISRKTDLSPWAFSPQHLFSCGGGACEKGWQPDSALSFLKNKGVPDEACFPYESGSVGKDVACSSSCSDASSRSKKIANYQIASFFFFSVDMLKEALKNGPLLTTMTVYEDFMFYKSGVYQHTSGNTLGGHAVTLEGWNDADKAWIVRNSWGEDWGEKGYFRIAWSDTSGIGRMSWSIDVGKGDGHVSFGTLRDRSVLTGTVPLKVESTFTDTKSITWQILQGAKVVKEDKVPSSGSVSLDTTHISDGQYQLLAIAERTSTNEKSQPRDISILNGTLTGTIAMSKPAAGATLKGKEVLEFDLKSAPVPFGNLVFRAKNVKTGKVVERRTPHVASKINLSFYTPNYEDGEWDLSLEGIAAGQSIQSAPVRITVKN